MSHTNRIGLILLCVVLASLLIACRFGAFRHKGRTLEQTQRARLMDDIHDMYKRTYR